MDMRALLEDYEQNHRSFICQATHAIGIPLIALSLPLIIIDRRRASTFFALGWVLQFLGHVAEGKPPKFFEGYQYFIAGMIWWLRFASRGLKTRPGRT